MGLSRRGTDPWNVTSSEYYHSYVTLSYETDFGDRETEIARNLTQPRVSNFVGLSHSPQEEGVLERHLLQRSTASSQ